jgi:hypothetical protein
MQIRVTSKTRDKMNLEPVKVNNTKVLVLAVQLIPPVRPRIVVEMDMFE